jgi:hypothetical protein
MSKQQLTYIRQDFLRVQPHMGIAVQVVNAARTIGGLTRALCLKFQGLEALLTAADELLALGDVLVYDKPDLLLAAIVGQVFPGPATPADTYDSRRKALYRGLLYTCNANPGRALYVPYMLACGQAGDEWKVIERMLENLPNQVYVCVPNWAESAAELLGYLPMAKPPLASELPLDETYAPMRSHKLAA